MRWWSSSETHKSDMCLWHTQCNCRAVKRLSLVGVKTASVMDVKLELYVHLNSGRWGWKRSRSGDRIFLQLSSHYRINKSVIKFRSETLQHLSPRHKYLKHSTEEIVARKIHIHKEERCACLLRPRAYIWWYFHPSFLISLRCCVYTRLAKWYTKANI